VNTDASKEKALSALHYLVQDKSYQKQAQKLGRLIELSKGAERGADWIEMVAELGSAPFVPEYFDLPWFQALNLDILATLFLILVLSLYVFWKIGSCCFRCFSTPLNRVTSVHKKEKIQ